MREAYEEGNERVTTRSPGTDTGAGDSARGPDRHDRRTGDPRLVRRPARSILPAWKAADYATTGDKALVLAAAGAVRQSAS